MKDKKIIIQTIVFVAVIAILGLSYAYFEMSIDNKNVKDQVVTTGTLKIKFTDGQEIKVSNLDPGTVIEKTVTVENVGTLDADYNLVWEELSNGIARNEMKISATCTMIVNGETGEACEGIDETPIRALKILKNVSIAPEVTHKYDIKITFIETNEDQSYNLKKTFEGKLGVEESREITPVYCTFDGDVVQDAQYTNGIYLYIYNSDNWNVVLKDKDSTDPVTEAPCTYINSKAVTNYGWMFYNTKASSIDVSNFDTSNVTDMNGMFYGSAAIEIKGLEYFDTSKVTNMSDMFYNCNATNLNISNFNTDNVESMQSMFRAFKGTSLGVSRFNTGNVIDMTQMFEDCEVNSLDVSGFDTKNVTSMSGMFSGTNLKTLNVGSFNTNKVTHMNRMFSESSLTEIVGLENFNTENVEYMEEMFFKDSNLVNLNLSSFDTSNVKYMVRMFKDCSNLKKIYVSDKFVTDKIVNKSHDLFSGSVNLVGGAGTVYDSSKTNSTYARIDGGTTNPGYFTLKNN